MLPFFSISASLEPNQEIETYEHFWLGTITVLHKPSLHLALSATPNVITPNVINYFITFGVVLHKRLSQCIMREPSGSVVECLTRNRRAAGSSLTDVTALLSLSKTHLS